MNGQLGGQFGGQMGMMAAAHDEDDVALSTFANGGGGRMSMALPADMHPLRAAMQSGMSSSTPHLAGSMNQYSLQQMQQQMQMQQHLQQQQQLQALQQQAAMYGAADQHRRMSAAHMQQAGAPPPSHNGNGASHGSMPFNAVNSRQSLASTNSGGSGGSSSASSPLAMHNRGAATQSAATGSRWTKEPAASARTQASTMPRPRGANGSGARANVTSVYELPGRSAKTEVSFASAAKPLSQPATKYSARFTTAAIDDSDEAEDSEDEGSDDDGVPAKKVSRELRQFFDAFVDKCLDVKPYAWLEFETAFNSYKGFCARNGLRGKDAANSSQFQDLMHAAEWQLKTKDSGAKAYYNTCLI
ncbi:hypothetical protein GGF42_009198 [Coemansia sp. RSA 2424]|nr:hypothetical protein GGF42_009198 [Coemansia sp. RSA 2424]